MLTCTKVIDQHLGIGNKYELALFIMPYVFEAKSHFFLNLSPIEDITNHTGSGPSGIIMDYFSCMKWLFEEQNMSQSEIRKIELCLGSLLSKVKNYWNIQPWFIGRGAVLIEWFLRKIYSSSKNTIYDKSIETLSRINGDNENYDIYIVKTFNDQDSGPLQLLIDEETFTTTAEANHIIPPAKLKGVGIFERELVPMAENLRRRIIKFHFNFSSKYLYFDMLSDNFFKNYGKYLENVYLTSIEQGNGNVCFHNFY